MNEPLLFAGVRTPIGKYLGTLADLRAPQLAAQALKATLARSGAPAEAIDEVILGQVLQAGVGQNPARQAALAAGLPVTIPAVTINKVCGSGLKAVMLAAQAIRAGDADLILAGGMENMSRGPFLINGARQGWKFGDQKVVDEMQTDGLWCAFENWSMGSAAEHTAQACGITRENQDRFAAQSQQRAAAAWEQGLFNDEVVPITVGSGAKAKTLARDEGVRADTTAAGLAKLRPSFSDAGSVTAGNSSTLSDGAASILVASPRGAEKLAQPPLAKIVAYGTSGIDPRDIFLAPIRAVRQVLAKAKLSIDDIDLFELNEAFASQMLACGQELKLDEAKVNVHGGAIALGHPIGASGARVLVTLLHAMAERKAKRGLVSLCLGGGNAVAMIVERME
ncbi:MAG: acetyl-CoA C-acetyltransferase [Planctomycetota bacterium]